MACSVGCAKSVLIIFCIFILVTGLGLVGVGAWLKADPAASSVLDISNRDVQGASLATASNVIIAVGVIAVLVGAMGCAGAMTMNTMVLSVFMVFLLLIMAMELGGGILAVVYKDRVQLWLSKSMERQILESYMPNNNLGKAWNFVHHRMVCCATNGPQDFKGSVWWDTQQNLDEDKKLDVPLSCCKLTNNDPQNPQAMNLKRCQEHGAGGIAESQYVNGRGCYKRIIDWINDNAPIVIGLGIGIGAMQIFGVIATLALIMAARKEEKSTPA